MREQIGADSQRWLEMVGYKHYVKPCSAFSEHVVSQFNAETDLFQNDRERLNF